MSVFGRAARLDSGSADSRPTLPDDPFTIFMDSYHHTGDMLADFGGNGGHHLLNRMIFSHQVTALEAYLGDT